MQNKLRVARLSGLRILTLCDAILITLTLAAHEHRYLIQHLACKLKDEEGRHPATQATSMFDSLASQP